MTRQPLEPFAAFLASVRARSNSPCSCRWVEGFGLQGYLAYNNTYLHRTLP